METISILILSGIVSLVALIFFFVLCANVSAIAKAMPQSDYMEYLIALKMGDKNKAFYYLQRELAKDAIKGINAFDVHEYVKKFEAIGLGLPDMEILNDFNKKTEQK